MCDTMVVPPSGPGGTMLFAKNSDREGDEAQAIEIIPRRTHAPGTLVHATYLTLPQVYETAALLICRPYWMWGAEMGVNEHGVAIGNEAVFSRLPHDGTPALTGMDLVRLGLERARSAEEAAATMIVLIERHGQGGNGGHGYRFPYDSAFMIADATSAFVLETAGRHWALERVTGARAISNAYSIGTNFIRLSANAKEAARDKGWWSEGTPFDFGAVFGEKVKGWAARGRRRAARACALIAGGVDGPARLMSILRDHGPSGEKPHWRPGGFLPDTLCAHGNAGPARRAAQTTMSLVAVLDRNLPVAWSTGGSAPCTGLFRPFFIEAGLPRAEPPPKARADLATLWWRQERLHRTVIRDHATRLATYAPARDALEAALIDEIARATALAADRPRGERKRLLQDVSRAAWDVAEDALARWTRLAEATPVARAPGLVFRHHWRRLARRAAPIGS
ncbi:peptidase family C69 [Zavarzinia aquatilis]|uniref:Peptidase family C69 n=1 Tax=Zavarzinia aquatilis TaxID=2211142 RepID=A0A317EI27_9PROT|nr:peptidase family C69 [Zavarzinia aquatilis]PWR25946.1 peptidase family C69 [Zavarzinia aquatilis]